MTVIPRVMTYEVEVNSSSNEKRDLTYHNSFSYSCIFILSQDLVCAMLIADNRLVALVRIKSRQLVSNIFTALFIPY